MRNMRAAPRAARRAVSSSFHTLFDRHKPSSDQRASPRARRPAAMVDAFRAQLDALMGVDRNGDRVRPSCGKSACVRAAFRRRH
jgi:hypothetical protein